MTSRRVDDGAPMRHTGQLREAIQSSERIDELLSSLKALEQAASDALDHNPRIELGGKLRNAITSARLAVYIHEKLT